jgi:molybdopterin molybdotransferase
MNEVLNVEDALDQLLAAARPVTGTDRVMVEESLGRVLAENIVATVTVPPYDNSAMDGYAVRTADVPVAGTRLSVAQRIAAGRVGIDLAGATAARIFTGAPIPPNADAVVMQEDCVVEQGAVVVNRAPRAGDNIRRAGEDVKSGDVVLHAGVRISPATMGMAATVGRRELAVFRRLRVALFSTGSELALPGMPLRPGQIYNSNRSTLCGLLGRMGCEVRDLGIVPDDLGATAKSLADGASWADVVVTSGGVSVGEEDHVKAAVLSLGELRMWKVAMKPGKPLAFGRVGQADFLGLPGNPVSAFATFCLFVRPFLARRQGCFQSGVEAIAARAGFDWPTPGRRREFLRARIISQADGGLDAVTFPNQGSGVLTSVVWADGFVDVAAGASVARGDTVRFLPFSMMGMLW